MSSPRRVKGDTPIDPSRRRSSGEAQHFHRASLGSDLNFEFITEASWREAIVSLLSLFRWLSGGVARSGPTEIDHPGKATISLPGAWGVSTSRIMCWQTAQKGWSRDLGYVPIPTLDQPHQFLQLAAVQVGHRPIRHAGQLYSRAQNKRFSRIKERWNM